MPPTHYHKLSEKWMHRHRGVHKRLWQKHPDSLQWLQRNLHHMTAASLGGVMLLASPMLPLPHNQQIAHAQAIVQPLDPSVFVTGDLTTILPDSVQPLTTSQETQISAVLTRDYGIPVSAELEGIRLNRSYGLIGAEQHLVRYPGDTMSTHFSNEEDADLYYSSGMAPGRGAWGYFAPSESEMTQLASDREKWYIAVQTFLSPSFSQNPQATVNFFKYRKMLVVNPQNGKAVVADIADSGPAVWTGKHLGGSPEVMKYLQRIDGAQRGPVLYFFIDDPNDTIPLGPIQPKNTL